MSSTNTVTIPKEAVKLRPIIKVSLQRPDLKWTPYYEFNFDTGASYPSDVPLEEVADVSKSGMPYKTNVWGSVGTRKTFTTKIKIQGLTGEYQIDVMRQDDDHYDIFRDQRPPTRYPLLRVRDLLKYMSFFMSKEVTTIRTGTEMPPELSSGKKVYKFPDMKKRSDVAYTCKSDGTIVMGTTPTSGYQWYKVQLKNPTTNEIGPIVWGPINTGERRCVVVDKFANQVHLTYPKLTSSNDYRADAKCSISFTESVPPYMINNETMQIRKYTEDFARGGDPRNLLGGPPLLNYASICLWGAELHMAFVDR